jgi:hypothetical protein
MADKKIMVQVYLTLDEQEYRALLQNSIERVMNNAISVGNELQYFHQVGAVPTETPAELASTLWQDCDELKPLVVKIWGAVQQSVREVLRAQG